jgi:murein DD-endopeptidase MepM/ murein hydrolase activator NlpD
LFSPSPSTLFSRRLLNTFHNSTASGYVVLALLLLLTASAAPAQTRSRRAGRREEEKNSKRTDDKRATRRDEEKKKASARVDDRKRKAPVVAARRETPKPVIANRLPSAANRQPVIASRQPVVANPLVKKTALTYGPKVENQAVKNQPPLPSKRPVLVNDITVVSRVNENPSSLVRPASVTRPAAVAGPSNIPSIWPVIGPLRSGVGVRSNPFGGGGSEYHKGQDIAAPIGTPVMATADGTIIVAGWQRGYGWVVYIDHGNGITTRYGHLSRIDVEIGQTIRRGEQLGLVGSTGRSTGPHLHYEVRINGQPVSPLQYLPQLSAPITAQRADAPVKASVQR